MSSTILVLLTAALALTATRERTAPPERATARETRDDGLGAQQFKEDLAFLQELKPGKARADDQLGARWAKVQGEVLTHLLDTGAAEVKAGGRPMLVFDIHDTLEGIDSAGLPKNDPGIQAAPGGPEFLTQALGRGVRVVILSNTAEKYRAAETETLRRIGYPVDDDHLTLLMKPDDKEKKWDSVIWKGRAAGVIAGMGGHVIAHVDDKVENLEAMSKSFKDSVPLQMSLDGPEPIETKSKLPKVRDLRQK